MRVALALLFAVVTTVHVFRTAAIAAWVEERPGLAASMWPDHPEVERLTAMAEVGAAAARGQQPPSATAHRLDRIAAAAPLAPEPFLVNAAVAQRAGDFEKAERLLLQARARSPRSEAARFLLADLYLRSGRVEAGLQELAVFSRLVPGATTQLAPALAQYVTTAGSLPQVRRVLAAHPELEPALLGELAKDSRNTGLILSLASRTARGLEGAAWQTLLLNKLVEEGAYERAYQVWAWLTRVPSGSGRELFNPRFQPTHVPPPFNWIFASGSEGVADPSGNGLSVLYFGRGDLVLASQLMLLQPGRYKLTSHIEGQIIDGGNVAWRITCLPSKQLAIELAVGLRAAGDVAGEFQVPRQGCAAQQIELRGIAKEFAKTANFRVAELRLVRSSS